MTYRLKSALVGSLLLLGMISAAGVNASQSAELNRASDQRSFVYTITNPAGLNAIAAYEANPETGELIFLDAYPTGGRGTGLAVDSQSPLVVDAERNLLYAVNPGSNDISVMSIKENGSLTAVGEPVPSRGIEPASIAITREFLYVANKGDATDPPNYSGFRIESDGTLSRIKRLIRLESGANPTQVLFSRDGRMLIGVRFGSGALDCFSVRPSGKLRAIAELNNQRGPFAAVFNPLVDGQLIVADARLPGASSYQVSEEGAVSLIAAISNAPERAACWIAAHSDGQRVWVANTGTNSLSLYTIGAGGALSLTGTHRTASFGRTPFEIALDPSGRFLYELNINSALQSIHALRVTESADGAGLADVGPSGLPAGSTPMGLVVAER